MNPPPHPLMSVLLAGFILAASPAVFAQSVSPAPGAGVSRIALRTGATGLRELPASAQRPNFAVTRYVAASQVPGNQLSPVAEELFYFELFRAGEINFDFYFTGAWGDGECSMTETREVTHTRRRSESFIEQIFTTVFDPQREENITTVQEFEREREREEEVVRHETFTRSTGFTEAYGLGLATSYFFTRNVGCGLEADWMGGSGDDFYAIRKLVIVRFPIENSGFAPYTFIGLGGQFGPDEDDFITFLGGGVIKRFVPEFGLFVDARGVTDWDCKLYVQVRTGFQLTFGP